MTELINTLLLIPVVTIMAYIVPVCLLDIWYREVENWYWVPLIVVNVPVAAYLYVSGWYPWYCLLISLVIVGIFAALVELHLLNGADFIFLACIALFWIVNPNPFPHGIQLQFYFYLLTAMALAGLGAFILNLLADRKGTWIEMVSTIPGGIPFMLPISLAFVMSYLWG